MKTKVDYTKLRERLPHGSLSVIAKSANVHLNTVHLVLKGKSGNMAVLNAIADYLDNKQQKEQLVNNKLAELINA